MIQKTGDFDKPLRKNRNGAYKIPAGFCLRINMTSDTFLEEADEWRDKMWWTIRQRPDVRFYILTKRAYRIAECLPSDWGNGYENVMLNITSENQRAFDERWPILEKIPARHKGLNLSPLLGPVDIEPALASKQIEHIDLSGESYGGKTPCRYEWIKAVSDVCEKYQVNFAVTALGSVFVRDGQTYHIDRQDIQVQQAFFSGLSRFYGNPVYRLYDAIDGHPLSEDELMKPKYNAEKCHLCTSMPTCAGCMDCGNCKEVRLVDHAEILRLQTEALANRKRMEGRR